VSTEAGTHRASALDLVRRLAVGRFAGVAVGLVGVCTYLSISEPVFLTWNNWQNIFLTQAVIAILAVGMTFVILTGGVDLSVASLTAAASMALGISVQHGAGWVAAALVAVAVGLALGLLNGLLIGVVRIPFFVVTLGTLSIYQSLALVTKNGATISLTSFGSFEPVRNLVNNNVGPFPYILLIYLGLYAAGGFVLRYTRFGRAVYAVGSNREAARLTGLPVTRILICVYTISGLTAGLASVAQAGRLSAASPQIDPNLMLTVVAAVLIGGTSFTGGDGGLLATLVGVLFLGVIQNGLSLSNINTFWQGAISGIVLILAVALGVLRHYGWRALLPRRQLVPVR
jgi:ribose transport system permease protein